VRVTGIGVYANGTIDPFLVAWKKRDFTAGTPVGVKNLWDGAESLFPAVTDDDGRFTLRGTGAERFVRLHFSGRGIAEAECWVVNRGGFDPRPFNEATVRNVPKGLEKFANVQLLYGPDPIVVAEAEKPIRGVVSAIDTGKGRAGVEVWLSRDGDRLLPFALKATTDAAGRYEVRGARKANAYMLEVKADVDAAYMACQARASDTAGYEPITVDIRMAKGVIVTGRVLDRSTGNGVRGLAMASVLNDNPFAKDYPEFNSAASMPARETTADGSFRIVTIPGPVLLMGGPRDLEGMHRYKQAVPDPKYPQYFPKRLFEGVYLSYGGGYSLMQGNSCKVLEIEPGTAVVRQDILLEPATTLQLRLRDTDGKPLTGALAAGTAPRDWFAPVALKTDACTAYDVEPAKRRLLVFFEPNRKLAGSLTLIGDQKSPVVVTLRPAGEVKGRLVGPDGHSLADVAVDLVYKDRPAMETHRIAYQSRQVVTGPDGAFAVDSILPGLPFDLSFKRQQKQFKLTDKPAASLSVTSGETRDLGSLAARAVGENADE
jgi:hypothetical protein